MTPFGRTGSGAQGHARWIRDRTWNTWRRRDAWLLKPVTRNGAAANLGRRTGPAERAAKWRLSCSTTQEYQRSLRERLIRGEAPRLELMLWELRYAKPRVEATELSKGTDPTADLVQLLETLGEDPNRHAAPPVVDQHSGKEDPSPPASAPHEANGETN